MNKKLRLWPAWFRGDFHAHTNHSDGSLKPAELLAEARTKQLDFFSITDHNVLSAYDQFGDHDDMLIIPGIEVTMKYGHFNVFGISGMPDWVEGLPHTQEDYTHHMRTGEAQYTPNELLRLTRSQGLFNSINHPLLGVWTWLDHETDLRLVDFLEIWNDPSWPDNETSNPNAVALWTRWLNAGHRITAIGGTDFHHARPKNEKDGAIIPRDHLNEPTTYVHAADLSGASIMAGLKQRHAYMSMGPQASFGATLGEQTFMMGDDIGAVDGRVKFQASALGEGQLTAQLICNGDVIAEAQGNGSIQLWAMADISAEIPQWFRLDIRNDAGQYLIVTNPIFCGPHITPTQNQFGDFV
ncbi:MAG: CehA/McbA family metallohydrolase [Candidatus Promineifilaceae bacterium]